MCHLAYAIFAKSNTNVFCHLCRVFEMTKTKFNVRIQARCLIEAGSMLQAEFFKVSCSIRKQGLVLHV